MVILFGSSVPQTNIVAGVVTSMKIGIRAGRYHFSSGYRKGTITDIDGQYAIEVFSKTAFGFFLHRFCRSGGQCGTITTLNVVLQPDVKTLDEVVVTDMEGIHDEPHDYPVSKLDGETLAITRSAMLGRHQRQNRRNPGFLQ